MAAGLPGVVSDWNGYKDTVRDGIDGLRVETLMPRGGLGADLADRHAAGIDSYDLYCGFSSQFVAIDPAAVAKAYMKLIENEDLRRRMVAAARARAIETLDWAVIIKRYQELWQELAELRKMGIESAPRQAGKPANPTRLDPFISFQSYASDILDGKHVVSANSGADGARLQMFLQSPLISFMKPVAPEPDDCARILTDLQRRGSISCSSNVPSTAVTTSWTFVEIYKLCRYLCPLYRCTVRIDDLTAKPCRCAIARSKYRSRKARQKQSYSERSCPDPVDDIGH